MPISVAMISSVSHGFCQLDGALALIKDCDHPMKYDGGLVRGLSSKLWG